MITADLGTPRRRVAFANTWTLSLFHRSSSTAQVEQQQLTGALMIPSELYFGAQFGKQFTKHLTREKGYKSKRLRSPIPRASWRRFPSPTQVTSTLQFRGQTPTRIIQDEKGNTSHSASRGGNTDHIDIRDDIVSNSTNFFRRTLLLF